MTAAKLDACNTLANSTLNVTETQVLKEAVAKELADTTEVCKEKAQEAIASATMTEKCCKEDKSCSEDEPCKDQVDNDPAPKQTTAQAVEDCDKDPCCGDGSCKSEKESN